MNTKKLVSVSILISLGIVLSIVESFIPLNVPGVKLGLANVVTLVAIYYYGIKEGTLVQIFRIIIVGLIYSGILSISFLLSLTGGLLSLIVMVLLKRYTKFNLMGISIFGSISHALGQIIISYFIISNTSVFYYLFITFTLSIICGTITSIIAKYVLKIFKMDIKLFGNIELITSITSLCLLITISIIQVTYKAKDNEEAVAKITYQNELVMEIDLSNPVKFKSYSDSFKKCTKEEDSYLYYFDVYNEDEKGYFTLVLEVQNKGIRIKEETCQKHICSNKGFIYSKFDRIVCLPNSFIIAIENINSNEIDIKL